MTTYNTYAECKIKNPQNQVVTTNPNWSGKPELKGKFIPADVLDDGLAVNGTGDWILCNPADHCMSLEAFFEAGHKFLPSDAIECENGEVWIVGLNILTEKANSISPSAKIFVLSAKALEERVEQVEWNGEGLPLVGTECEIYCPKNPAIPDGDKDWMKTEIVAIINCGFGAETTFVYKTPWSVQWYVDAHPSDSLKFRKIETPEQKKEPKQVEWKSGDLVEYHNKHENEGGLLTFVGIHPAHKGHAVLYGKHIAGGYISVSLSMLSKPETPEQKKELELLEAAHELYNKSTNTNVSFEDFKDKKSNKIVEVWIKAVEITGYRKPE